MLSYAVISLSYCAMKGDREKMTTHQSRVEQILKNILGHETVLPEPQSRIETLLLELNSAIKDGGTAQVDLTGRLNNVAADVEEIKEEQTAQNIAIDECLTPDDIVIMSESVYGNITPNSRTALLYFLYEG